MKTLLSKFVADERGVTAIEYGMIAALVAVAIITTLGQVGLELDKTFTIIRDAIHKANAQS